jgi:hypothetical protein
MGNLLLAEITQHAESLLRKKPTHLLGCTLGKKGEWPQVSRRACAGGILSFIYIFIIVYLLHSSHALAAAAVVHANTNAP